MRPADLAQLYDSHAKAVFAFALNLTRDREAAQEILQEVFIRAARQERLILEGSQERSWLFRTAHHLVIDHSRRSGSRARTIERAALEPADLFAGQADPDARAFREAVAAAMLVLPEEQRAVVHLKLWEHLSFSQIGEVLGISPNTASSRYRYAIDKLQERLRSLYEEIR